ncbi:hypothetical protein [Massilia timonae]|uniref:hypothetical protein n=1 Tax=Massilia timonae TaxID=47229 RepID=UPI0028D906FB|nr:hypothetical protein [Massilia timonae]
MMLDDLKIAAVGVALLGAVTAAALSGYHFGASSVQLQWDADKVERAEAAVYDVRIAVATNEAERQRDIALTRATLATYQRNLNEAEKRIAAERAAADRLRLRIAVPARVCAAAGGTEAPGPVVAHDAGATEYIELPKPTEQNLRDLVRDADLEIERLREKVSALQDWARTHGFYEVGGIPPQ